MKKFVICLFTAVLVAALCVPVLVEARDNATKQTLSDFGMPQHHVAWAICEYRYAVDGNGAQAGVAGITNKIDLDVEIPDNAIIIGGFKEVIEAFLPTSANTNGLMIQSSGDLIALDAAMFEATGIGEMVPKVEDSATWIKLTDDRTVYLETVGTAITQGVVRFWIPYVQGL